MLGAGACACAATAPRGSAIILLLSVELLNAKSWSQVVCGASGAAARAAAVRARCSPLTDVRARGSLILLTTTAEN